MDAMARLKKDDTRLRWERAMKEIPFDDIRHLKLVETQPDYFLRMFEMGTVCTNIFLRRLRNFALDMDWLPKAIIPRKQWPKIEFKDKRGITLTEHESILAGEHNSEWRAYYNLLWYLAGRCQLDTFSGDSNLVDSAVADLLHGGRTGARPGA
jgi:hypothetical protein